MVVPAEPWLPPLQAYTKALTRLSLHKSLPGKEKKHGEHQASKQSCWSVDVDPSGPERGTLGLEGKYRLL